MFPMIKAATSRLILLIPIVLALTTGCDSAREKVAAAIKPVTVEEVTASVNEKIGRREYSQARTEGSAYLNDKGDPSGKLAWALAKACAQTGDRDQAIKYVEQALKANAITTADAMGEPLLEPLRDDTRFVALLGGASSSDSATAKAEAPAAPLSPDRTEPKTAVVIDAKGIEARAGDVVVKLPN